MEDARTNLAHFWRSENSPSWTKYVNVRPASGIATSFERMRTQAKCAPASPAATSMIFRWRCATGGQAKWLMPRPDILGPGRCECGSLKILLVTQMPNSYVVRHYKVGGGRLLNKQKVSNMPGNAEPIEIPEIVLRLENNSPSQPRTWERFYCSCRRLSTVK
jgi:hypothetical protein